MRDAGYLCHCRYIIIYYRVFTHRSDLSSKKYDSLLSHVTSQICLAFCNKIIKYSDKYKVLQNVVITLYEN